MTVVELLDAWVERRLSPEAVEWFSARRVLLRDAYSERALQITFGMIPRRLGKSDLMLQPEELRAADVARNGWVPASWSVTDAARVLVLLETADAGNAAFAERFSDLCRTADLGELVSLYRGLPLYPHPRTLEDQAAEGLRTNMRAVFEAVAHANPFPREVFDEHRWNQMVLKALFVDSPLAPIQGLDARANADLALMLCDYAHERWAAGRPISPELWRCVGPHATGRAIEDLARALAESPGPGREAAALALSMSPSPDAAAVLAGEPELASRIASGELSWERIAPGSP